MAITDARMLFVISNQFLIQLLKSAWNWHIRSLAKSQYSIWNHPSHTLMHRFRNFRMLSWVLDVQLSDSWVTYQSQVSLLMVRTHSRLQTVTAVDVETPPHFKRSRFSECYQYADWEIIKHIGNSERVSYSECNIVQLKIQFERNERTIMEKNTLPFTKIINFNFC